MPMTPSQQTDAYRFFAIAFGAAPGVEYMNQIAAAFDTGAGTKQIVNEFTKKSVFTNSYPNFLTNEQFAARLIDTVVGAAASDAAKTEAKADVVAALAKGSSRGDVIFQIFSNLASLTGDAKWGDMAAKMANQVAVSRYYTETLLKTSTDIATLQAVLAGVDQTTSTTAAALEARLNPPQVKSLTLTTSVDSGAGFLGGAGNDTYSATLGGAGATLNGFDALDGGAGVDTLQIFDTATAAQMVLPTGLRLDNIEKISVSTASNVGNGAGSFDTSSYTGLTEVAVTSSGGAGDSIKAAATTNLVLTNSASGVTADGGRNSTVTAKGAVTSTNAAGAVSITQTDTTGGVNVVVGSGTDVTVSQRSATGTVSVGGNGTDPNPTGAVLVTQVSASGATGTGAISVRGGSAVTVAATGNAVTIGGSAVNSPSGAVTVTQSFKGNAGDITINGGVGATVTTTGGGTVDAVSIGATTPSGRGAVAVTNTSANVVNNVSYDDTVLIRGGSSVSVTTSASAAAITVGNTPALDAAGTALTAASAAQLPTGDVSISNSSVSNSRSSGAASTVYGTATTNVTMNGGASASFVGGAVTVTDAQTTLSTGGSSAGTAIGTSKLATVSLTGVTSASINSDALSTLNLTRVANAGNVNVSVANNTASHSLAVNLNTVGSSTFGTAATVTDNKASTVTIADAGTSSNRVAVSGSKLTSLSIANANSLTVTSLTMDADNAGTITATGAGTLLLPSLVAASKLSSIDASAKTGAVSVTIDGNVTGFRGGSGNDTVTISNGISTVIDGGAGTGDIVRLNAAATTYTPLLSPGTPLSSLVRGFEILSLASGATGSYNASGFTGVRNDGAAAAVNFTNVAVGTTLTIGSANPTGGTTVTLPSGTSSTNAFEVIVAGSTTSSTSPRTAGTFTLTGAGTSGADGVSAVTITSTGANASTFPNTITYADGAAGDVSALTVAGTAPVTVTYNPGTSSALATVNITNTKPVTLAGANMFAATGVAVTGGAGRATIDTNNGPTTSANNSVTSGAGGVSVTVGVGGAGGASGSESINLAASPAVQDRITVNGDSAGNGRRVSISGFTTIETSASDRLTFATAQTAVANTSAPTAAPTSANGTYTIANGVLTFSTVSSPNSALADLQTIVNAAGANRVLASVINGTTYVVSSGTSNASTTDDAIIALSALTGVKGFGITAAENTILVSNASNVPNVVNASPAAALTNTGTAAVAVQSAAGFSAITLGTNNTLGTTSTKFTDLSPSAVVTNGANSSVKPLEINQSGTAGKNSLTFVEPANTGITTVDKLTVNGARALTVFNSNTSGLALTAIEDGATTNTLATITVTGPGPTTISGVTDTAITLIDASTATGAFTLTGITKPAVTVTGANAANNTITVAGANAVISVGHTGATGHSQSITANGTGSSVTLWHDGTTQTSGTASFAITANGAGATVDTSAFVSYGTTASTISATGLASSITVGPALSGYATTVTVGQGSTVTLYNGQSGAGSAANVSINLSNATAGDTSSGTYYFTTIKGTTASTNLALLPAMAANQYAFTTAPVNVATATSLAAALNLAATASGMTVGNSYVSWFQYAGDTYVVANKAEAAATTGFDAGDTIIKLTGLVDLSGVTAVGTGANNTQLQLPLGI